MTAPSFEERPLPVYEPINHSLRDVKDAIPEEYFERSLRRGLMSLGRDLAMASFAIALVWTTDTILLQGPIVQILHPAGVEGVRWLAWLSYWWFQGLILTGLWVLGHECGHGAFSKYQRINDVIGFIIHTSLWTPYFSWKISHHRHHISSGSMEKDQVYVPMTRSDLGIPQNATPSHYQEILGDTPVYTLFMLVRQQILGFPAYLCFNISGPKGYPKWTNHFNPNAVIFTPPQWRAVILSDLGIGFMSWAFYGLCATFGAINVFKYYGLPWLIVTNWFIMVTYLQHTAPEVPHYRRGAWSFTRGAAATVDRDFLGWQGKFFLHGVAHYHVVHHFFPKMPFYHGEDATRHLKAFLGPHYNFSNQPTFKSLWDTYNRCQFVEDKGNVLFYRDRLGQPVRRAAEELLDCNPPQ